MNELDITISDLNDISEILDNNGYGGWRKTLDKAVELLKEQQAEIKRLKSERRCCEDCYRYENCDMRTAYEDGGQG